MANIGELYRLVRQIRRGRNSLVGSSNVDKGLVNQKEDEGLVALSAPVTGKSSFKQQVLSNIPAEAGAHEVVTPIHHEEKEKDKTMQEEEGNDKWVFVPVPDSSSLIQTDAEDALQQSAEESTSLPLCQSSEEEQSIKAVEAQKVPSKKQQSRKIPDREEDFDEQEYEECKLIRIFNADHGRKASMTELTDKDVTLTNIESLALDFSSEIDRESRRAVREFFIQIRKAFCESINFQKECKSMKIACSKAHSRVRKQREHLLKIRQERARISSELSKLQEDYKMIQSKHHTSNDLCQFLSELNNLQQQMIKTPRSQAKEKKTSRGSVDIQGLLSVSNTLLSTSNHVRHVNNRLQLWLDEH